jgi:hypothetical protein
LRAPDRGGRNRGCRFKPKEKAVKSHEHRRSRRDAPVDTRAPEEVALGRAIMLARTLRWREEWQAEVAARAGQETGKSQAGKPNGHAAIPRVPGRPRRADDTAGQFAAAVARNELGRFYWNGQQEEALVEARKKRKTKVRKTRPK